MNTFLSDNSHGRLEINEKLIKSELVQTTSHFGRRLLLESTFFFFVIVFFLFGQNAKSNKRRLWDQTFPLICSALSPFPKFSCLRLCRGARARQIIRMECWLWPPQVELPLLFLFGKVCGDERLTFAWQRGVGDLHLFPRGCAPHTGKTFAIMQNL